MSLPHHHRRSIRIPGYDYTNPGAYFLTFCTYQRSEIFGSISEQAVQLSPAGIIAQWELKRLPKRFSHIQLGEFVIMPNHVHVLIHLIQAGTGLLEKYGQPVPGSIPTIVRSYKSTVSRRINQLASWKGQPVWQRNYYEHIVRDEHALNRISAYIRSNPSRWAEDKFFS
jgi:putative transposase